MFYGYVHKQGDYTISKLSRPGQVGVENNIHLVTNIYSNQKPLSHFYGILPSTQENVSLQ